MQDIRRKWLTFYADHVEQSSKEVFGYVEKQETRSLGHGETGMGD